MHDATGMKASGRTENKTGGLLTAHNAPLNCGHDGIYEHHSLIQEPILLRPRFDSFCRNPIISLRNLTSECPNWSDWSTS